MAEVVKKKNKSKYNIEDVKVSKKNNQKNIQKQSKKETPKKEEKKNIFTRTVLFFKGVRSEVKKVHWLDKKDMIKYSVATIYFIVFFALFFYAINLIFAIVQSVFN